MPLELQDDARRAEACFAHRAAVCRCSTKCMKKLRLGSPPTPERMSSTFSSAESCIRWPTMVAKPSRARGSRAESRRTVGGLLRECKPCQGPAVPPAGPHAPRRAPPEPAAGGCPPRRGAARAAPGGGLPGASGAEGEKRAAASRPPTPKVRQHAVPHRSEALADARCCSCGARRPNNDPPAEAATPSLGSSSTSSRRTLPSAAARPPPRLRSVRASAGMAGMAGASPLSRLPSLAAARPSRRPANDVVQRRCMIRLILEKGTPGRHPVS